MMSSLWVVLFVTLTGSHSGYGLPVRPTPQTYPHDGPLDSWSEGAAFVAIPALALVIVAIAFLLGCTWCYRHKDCKPNEGSDNQLFTASAQHIHTPQRLQPPDSGFSEPVNNNVAGEDNNNGPISLREMQNIANNNAGAYIFNENEERNANRYTNSRESIVLFDPLPMEIHVDDPLEPYSEWFTSEHLPRDNLQYLREVGRGWFGRVVASEIGTENSTQTVAVKILNQNSSLEEKARFLEETRVYRDLRHDHILQFLGKCLEEEPWLLLFEFCPQDLQGYLILNRPRMAILNESGVPLQLMSDVSSALAYMHSHGFTYGYLWSGSVLVRGDSEEARAVLGRYEIVEPEHDCFAPEVLRRGAIYTPSSEIWSLGTLIWEVCSWGSIPNAGAPSPPPELPCPYKNHLYQVMQLCWNLNPDERPTSAQVNALINHLHATHTAARAQLEENVQSDLYAGSDFEERWQRLKPNSIPKVDEHIAIIHAPSTSAAHFTESEPVDNTLSVDMDTAVSRSSSIMSDKDPLESQIKSESLTNLHGSLEDVGNIYLTHNETAALECNQGNILEQREKENDRSDSSVDPWLKEIIAGSQDDVSYYKDVSDVIKNLDNILNSEKTSSSESSHQASPSRDNLSLDCKKEYPVQSSMVKSPGISNFQNLLDTGFPKDDETENEDELDRDTIGTLSHSYERHSDTASQHTLENITPDTPIKDFDVSVEIENQTISVLEKPKEQNEELPKVIVDKKVPKLKELCVVSNPSLSETVKEQLIVKDCETSCDSIRTDNEETKSLVDVVNTESIPLDENEISFSVQDQMKPEVMQLVHDVRNTVDMPSYSEEKSNLDETSEDIRTETDELETETDDLKTESDEMRSQSEDQTKVDEPETKTDEEVQSHTDNGELGTDEVLTDNDEVQTKSEEIKDEKKEDAVLPVNKETSIEEIDTLPSVTEVSITTEASHLKLDSFDDPETAESVNNYSTNETILVSDLDIVSDSSKDQQDKTESKLEIAQGKSSEIVQTHDKKPIDAKNEIIKSIHEPVVEEFDSIIVNQEPNEHNDSKKENTTPIAQTSVECIYEAVGTIDNQHVVDSEREVNNSSEEVNQLKTSNESTTPQDMPKVSSIDNQVVIYSKESVNHQEFVCTMEAKLKTTNESTPPTELPKIDSIENQEVLDSEKTVIQDNSVTKEHKLKTAIELTTPSDLLKFYPIDNQEVIESEEAEIQENINRREDKLKTTIDSKTPTDLPKVDSTYDQEVIDSVETVNHYGDIVTNENTLETTSESTTLTHLLPALVQNTNNTENLVDSENVNENVDIKDDNAMSRSDNYVMIDMNELINGSTVYKDLINNTNSLILNSTVDNYYSKNIETSQNIETPGSTFRNESTVYMDLPSFEIIKRTHDFLDSERVNQGSNNDNDKICSSTPLASDNSADTIDTLENTKCETLNLLDTKDHAEMTVKELRRTSDCMSPFDSPTKSHPTDTFDENSSVVLGSLDNCSMELNKGMRSSVEMVEIPREELLAFSSNFSEMNLETPSPLRDGNFLNEVPDIMPDDNVFDDLASITEPKDEPLSDSGSGPDGTEKHVSPSTPPNSPGVFPSTSAPKYLVEIDLNEPVVDNLQDEIELNQIELQLTSKLAIAENENNLNIEYSGPLTVEGLIEEGGMMRENDEIPEAFLAGNGEVLNDIRENLSLDEECVKALRNELELKLPLAQVASIEPQVDGDGEWPVELPPPPELVVSYPGALSPIQEETGPQLSAYENDIQWNPSIRTDSSESYPEPCNNSTDDVTELPTGNQEHTYTMPSKDNSLNHTYTVCKETAASSRDLTMSADSLNASPLKLKEPTLSPIDDKTYNKEDKDTNCERISQVSPFLVSPTTDTSAPELSDNTRVSTSKTTLPTDAKHSKPESQCLSKATSIDSWCSNDTLYNVEENFDDLALEPEPDCVDNDNDGNSESTDTLTHHDEVHDQDLSHCSTYIVHESKSENCESFSPDSITANDNYTYTKVKTDVLTTPSATDVNDSTKPSKDLAYGTLMSGIASYSCTTEVATTSGLEDAWKLPKPELIRRSPQPEEVLSPTRITEEKECKDESNPNITDHHLKKMDSVEMSCLEDNLGDESEPQGNQDVAEDNLSPTRKTEEKKCKDESNPNITDHHLKKMDSVEMSCLEDNLGDDSEPQGNQDVAEDDSPNCQYRHMVPSITSTPIVQIVINDDIEAIPMDLPEVTDTSIPSFRNFQQSVEVRPQDLSSNTELANDTKGTESLLEGNAQQTLSGNNSSSQTDRSPNYYDFVNSAVAKPQDLNSRGGSSQNMSGVSSEGFMQFENSARYCPQDLTSLIDASSLLLRSERMSGEAMSSISPSNSYPSYQTSQSENQTQSSKIYEQVQSSEVQSLPNIPPTISNLTESQVIEPSLLINFGPEDEEEQPHSIIVTEVPMNATYTAPKRTCDTHTEYRNVFSDLHQNCHVTEPLDLPNTNGEVINELDSLISIEQSSNVETVIENEAIPKITESLIEKEPSISETESPKVTDLPKFDKSAKNDSITKQDLLNGSVIQTEAKNEIPTDVPKVNGNGVNIATVNFLSETFEELMESNVDDKDDTEDPKSPTNVASPIVDLASPKDSVETKHTPEIKTNGEAESHKEVTEDFLQNEKNFCQLDSFLPLLSDIRFTGPATEIMSTSFSQDSPTEPNSPECEQDKPTAAEILKDWDSDSESHSSNSSSGEFIWKDGDGRETAVVTTTHFDHQRSSSGPAPDSSQAGPDAQGSEHGSEVSGDSCSGSEGDEVEFVPSSWDCCAAPAKSSLRSLEQASLDSAAGEKKRVVFKRQKYHCVYEYPREALDAEPNSPAYLPDLSTYSEWDPSSVEEAELCYGHLFSMPSYPLRAGIAIGADYDEDFFISSSARPFESLGIMSTTSQFFPGMHVKPMMERELPEDIDDFPPPPSPLPTTTLIQSRTPSLDFTTPDSGVEDITPGSTTDEEFKKKLPETELTWRPVDSASSSESVSPSSPGGEALGGLRHTRDKLKLDLPPSPHIPSPRHNRVFNFVLDKPKRRQDALEAPTPLVMTDETPIVTTNLPLPNEDDLPLPEPTFSTFGKSTQKVEPEQKIILAEEQTEKEESKVVEPVKGEGTVLDSGDEDSGIESSKATLERKANVS